jgi:hypothetical protein
VIAKCKYTIIFLNVRNLFVKPRVFGNKPRTPQGIPCGVLGRWAAGAASLVETLILPPEV